MCAAARTTVRDIVVSAKQMFPPNGNRQTEIERPSRSYVVPPRSTNARARVRRAARRAPKAVSENTVPRKTALIATDVDGLLGWGSISGRALPRLRSKTVTIRVVGEKGLTERRLSLPHPRLVSVNRF